MRTITLTPAVVIMREARALAASGAKVEPSRFMKLAEEIREQIRKQKNGNA